MSNRHTQRLKQAVDALTKMQKRFTTLEAQRHAPIAIVGMGCRLPGGVSTPQALWTLLDAGEDAVAPIPVDRWDVDAWFDPDPGTPGRMSTRSGGFIDDIYGFDPILFGIAPREVPAIDPQQRLLLEVAWRALEDAGLARHTLSDDMTGVFVGIGPSDYILLQHAEGPDALSAYAGTGTGASFAAGRISHLLGLKGPTMSVDTACSSSLVALHLAVQSLRLGECRVALAAGVQLILSPTVHVILSRTRALAPDGRCKAFSANADGYGRGEGCGVLVLKRLVDARADGDQILAVIRGSAVNHDGASSGLTVPNGSAQRAVLQAALANARLSASDVSYIEAHGTGTALGDPIEIESLAHVYGEGRTEPLRVGSLKSNIGHLESASGIAGVIKTVLALHHRKLPASLHTAALNPHVRWSALPVQILQQPEEWHADVRRAGISAFGMSGTNAHVILEEATAPDPIQAVSGPHLFPISGHTRAVLSQWLSALCVHLSQHPEAALGAVSAMLGQGRAHLEHRVAVVTSDRATLIAALQAAREGQAHPALIVSPGHRRVARQEIADALDALDGSAAALQRAGALYAAGATLPWSRLAPGQRAALPPLPFQRQPYTLPSGDHHPWRRPARTASSGRYALSGELLAVPGGTTHQVLRVGLRQQPWLADHVVHDHVVVPGSFHLATVLAVAADRFGAAQATLEDVQFLRAMLVDGEADLHLVFHPEGADRYRFELASPGADETSWTHHATGWLVLGVGSEQEPVSLTALQSKMQTEHDPTALISRLAETGLVFGDRWKWMQAIAVGGLQSLSRLEPMPGSGTLVAPLHPILIDNGFASGLPLLPPEVLSPTEPPHVPYAVERLRWSRPTAAGAWCCVTTRRKLSGPVEAVTSDLVLFSDDGAVLAEVVGLTSKRAPSAAFLGAAHSPVPLYRLGWHEHDAPPAEALRPVVVSMEDGAADALAAALGVEAFAVGEQTLADMLTAQADQGPLTVLAVWGADSTRPDPTEAVTSALGLLQGVLAQPQPPKLWLVTARGCAVQAGEPVAPEIASLTGLFRCALEENPGAEISILDIGSEPNWAKVASVVESPPTGEHLALRGDALLHARLERAAQNTSPTVQTDGLVVVTGGFGGLGRQISTDLVQRMGVRHLLLIGRRTRPEAPWIAELQDAGATVHMAAADVGDLEALSAALASATASVPLRGVVHAAGVIDDGVLAAQTPQRLAGVFRAKVLGALNLHHLTRDSALDFFVLYSSAAGLLGGAAQSTYGAANAALDGLAEARRAAGLPALSVAWGPWEGDGMASSLSAADRERLGRLGLRFLSPEPALDALYQAIHGDVPVVAALNLDLRALAARRHIQPLLASLIPRTYSATAPQPGSPASLQEAVERAVRETLDLPADTELSVDRPLQDLGLDSLMAVDLRNALSDTVGARLPATLLFDYPSVSELLAFLQERIGTTEPTTPTVLPRRTEHPDEPIAIVGMGCRFPGGVRDPDSLWALLLAEQDAITSIPTERWSAAELYDPSPGTPGKIVTREGGFIEGAYDFAPDFFGVGTKEALAMDPQHRLLIETAWEALEHAGIPPRSVRGSATGVFVGLMLYDYISLHGRTAESFDGHIGVGTAPSVASGRLSYLLGARGPSMTLDTACSSSLVALHLASQSLRSGECSLALAGGSSLLLAPSLHLEFSRLGALAPDGRCKTFSAAADGVSWSEGVGVVVLKRLSDAQRDGDPILALIRGSAVNQDGRSQGLTAPNGPAQEAVIRSALAAAGVSTEEISYVEAHGTGTPLGDPIELQALAAVLGQGRRPDQPVLVGSVKTNLGHTLASAGMAGLMKTVLAAQHGVIPRSLHFDQPNTLIDWEALPVQIAAEALPWPSSRRLAGVSAFGISGTNAHVIVEGIPVPEAAAPTADWRVFPLSAPDALETAAERLADSIERHNWLSLDGIAATLAFGRTHHRRRLAVVARDRDALIAALRAAAQGTANDAVVLSEDAPLPADADADVSALWVSARRHVSGADVDWAAHLSPQTPRVPLPATPLKRQRYALAQQKAPDLSDASGHPLLGRR
ncbi:MAG: acyl transferase domain-containing protein, partial [Myxococcota bacterium]